MLALTATEVAIISACPAAAAIVAVMFIAIKLVIATNEIKKTVATKAEKEEVKTLIEELRKERRENIKLKRVLQHAVETTTKVKYEDLYDENDNKKV